MSHLPLSRTKVLILEDEVTLAEMFARWLRLHGCQEVRTANGGQAALDLLKSFHADVLVADLHMPPPDGFEVLRRLAATQAPIACVAFVSTLSAADRSELERLGVKVMLAKPFPPEELVEAVLKAIL